MEVAIIILSVYAVVVTIGFGVFASFKPKEKIVIKEVPAPRTSDLRYTPSVDDYGVISSRTGIHTTHAHSDVKYELYVKCVGSFEKNIVKIVVEKILILNIDKPEYEGVITEEFNKYYGVGVEFLRNSNHIAWEVDQTGNILELSNSDLSTLVKTSKVEADGITLELTGDYNYKDRLEIILES